MKNIIRNKSFGFSIRIVKLYKYLVKEQREFIVSKQILRSGTSIGANVEEGSGGQTKKDFIMKFSIAYKETRETSYWIRLLYASNYISLKHYESLIKDCNELLRILASIITTAKSNL